MAKKKYEDYLKELQNLPLNDNGNEAINNNKELAPTKSKIAQQNVSAPVWNKNVDVAPVKTIQKNENQFNQAYDEYESKKTKEDYLKELQNLKIEENKSEEKDTNKWFKGGAFEEDSGLGVFETPTDIAKTILGTGADAFTKVGSTLWNMGGELGKLGAGAIAQITGNEEVKKRIAGKDEETNKRLENLDLFNKANKIVDKNSVLGDKSDKIVESIGQIGGYAAASAINPALGNAVMFGTSAGSSLGENYGKENVTDAQAWTNALAKGGISVATEKAFGLFSKGKGIDTTIANKISSKLSSGFAKTLSRIGVQATFEAAEEALEYLGDQLLDLGMDAASNGKGAKFHEDWNWEEVGAQMGNAFISSLLVGSGTNALGIAGSKGNNLKEKVNNFAIQQDIVNKAKSKNEQKVINLLVQEQIDEKTKNNEKVNKKQIQEQVEKDLEKGYVDIETIEQALGGDLYNQYQNIQTQYNDLQTKIDELLDADNLTERQKRELSSLENQRNELNVEGYKNQLRDYVNNLTQNDPFIRNSYNEYQNKGNAFQVDLDSIDEKLRPTYERAMQSNLLNDTNRTHDFVDFIAKLENDKGIKFNFTSNNNLKETGFVIDGKKIGGFINKDGISVNIDSDKALNSVVGHEITHALEGTKLYDALATSVKEYAETRGEYETRYNDLKELYKEVKDANIEKELTADLIGDYLFTDEEFVKRLSVENRNLFQKIYDEIKYLSRLLTAGSKEGRQLEKAKHLFEKVYRQQDTNIPSKTQYMIDRSDIMQDYTTIEKENLLSNKNNIILNDINEIDSYVDDAYNHIGLDKVLHYGILKQDVIDKIKSNISNNPKNGWKFNKNQYELAIREDSFLHLSEDKTNITKEDVKEFAKKLPDIVANFDSVEYSKNNKNEGLRFIKKFDDGNYVSFVLTSDKKNRLLAKSISMDKESYVNKNRSISPKANEKSLAKTSETNGAFASSSNNIPQNDTKVNDISTNSNMQESEKNTKFSVSEKTGKLQENGKDIKLETSDTGTTGTLMAMHNLSEDKFNGIMDLGGAPVPSIAITNPEKVDHNGFGDGTLLFKKDTINPSDKLNEVYDRDVWSPRFPTIDREISSKNVDKVAKNIGMSESSLQSLAEEYNTPENLAYRLSRDTDIVEKYLKDNNIKYSNEDNIRKIAEENGIIDYLNNQLEGIYGEKGIYNNKSYLTDSGRRRTFWELHDEYNLENVVKNLTKQDTISSETTLTGAGFGNIQANMANRLNSIDDIKNNESRILTREDADAKVQPLVDTLNNEMIELSKLYGEKFDPFWDMDSINYQLQEFSKLKKLTPEGFYKIANTYNPTLANADSKLVDRIIDTMNEIKNIPTDYFEAKPQRAVGLNEIQMAVIPNNWSVETKQRLTDKGIPYTEYDPNVEGDRQRVVNQFEDLKFSISNQNENIAPIGNYRIKGEDIKLQDIAPIGRQTENNIEINTENNVKNNARDKYDYIYEDFGKNINNNSSEDIAPINTKEQKKLVNFQQKDYDSFIPNVIKRQYEQLRNKNGNNETELEVNKNKLRQVTDTFKEMFVNQNNEIDHLAKDTNNMAIKHKGDMINSAIAEAQNDMNVAQTDNYGNTIGKSVTEAFRPAKEANLEVPFNDYLLHWTNIERNKYGKGSNIPEIVSEQLVQDYEKTYPQFKIWGKDVWQIGKNALKNQLDSGLINQDQYNFYDKNYAHYVPFMENVDMSKYIDDTGEIKARKTIKKSKGGANQYNMLPVEEAIAKYIYSQKMSVRQNELYKEIVNTLYKDGDNTNPSGMYDPSYADMKDSLYTDENGNYLTAFVDGESKSVKISDDLYKALKNDTATRIKNLEERLSLLTKPLQKVSNVRRKILVDWNPTFIVKNFLKDFQDATLNSKYTKDFFKNYPNAVKELLANNTDRVKQFRNLYGSGTLGEYDTKSKNAKFLGRLATMNETIELAPRYAEFISSLENGTSVEEALYNAKEVTTNFGRGGTITKALNRNGATFLNASVQGFSKFIRNFSGENGAKGVVNSLAKAAIFGIAPAVFNELAFGAGDDKDEDYEALPDYIKDNYYIVKLGKNQGEYDDKGNIIKIGGSTFLRIPKGRMLSVFGSAARRTLELAEGEEDAFKGYGNNAWNQVGFNDVGSNNIFAPLTQAFGSENGEAWYGGDIVPYRLQKEKPEDQFDEKTDEFSKFLGKMLKVSPKKVNYVIDQYSGGVGDIVLPLITKEATSNTNNPLGIALAPIKDQFVVDSTSDNKYASEFYDTKDNLYTGSKATDEDLVKAEYMSDISYELSKLYKEKREIQNSDLPRDERFKKSQAIQDQINALAKEGLDNYQDVQKADKYAIVNDREYYKNANDEWKAVKDEDIDELNKIGMDIQEKSNFYNAKNKIYTTTENYKKILNNVTDEDEKSAIYHDKKVEIINTIKNTKMSDAGKAYLYDKYYGDTDTLNGLVDLKVDMNQYLDLEMQDFTADKYANGKTIPNSKKNKVFNYINQMNIPYEQKLLLAKIKYSSYDAGNRTIIQYLNNSEMSYEDEVKFLKKLGFKVSKDGRITWS